jgi:uncharacterized protein YbaP (TraB family)
MKKLLAFYVLIVLTTISAFAQSSVWKITKGNNSLYIGGSVHVLRAQDYPLPKEFDMAFEKSDILVFEANISEVNDPESIQKTIQFMILPQGKTLKTVLREKTYELLRIKCEELGLPIGYMENFTPFAVANIITVAQLEKLGFTPQGVDIHYIEKAKKAKKRVEFLETIEFQMKLLYDFGMIGDEYVLQSIDDLNNLKNTIPSVIAEWRNGTSSVIDNMQNKAKEKFSNLYKTIIINRNKNWLALIEKYLATKEVEFIIVGLGHMQNSDGLLKSLKDRGYKVEYVK